MMTPQPYNPPPADPSNVSVLVATDDPKVDVTVYVTALDDPQWEAEALFTDPSEAQGVACIPANGPFATLARQLEQWRDDPTLIHVDLHLYLDPTP